MSRRIARIALAFSIASGLGTSALAQVPVFKLWVTEVYELEQIAPDEWLWTPKCGDLCPTQHLPQGVALQGDYINIEVTVEGWDPDPDVGICNDLAQTEGCTVGDDATCLELGSSEGHGHHCTLTESPCDDDGDCNLPSMCDPDRCLPHPLVRGFQWMVSSLGFFNGGTEPGLIIAEIPCSDDEDCQCPWDLGWHLPYPGGRCQFADGTCSLGAAIYLDVAHPDSLCLWPAPIVILIILPPSYGVSVICRSPIPEFEPGPPPRSSPYYVGTMFLQATTEACGSYVMDLRHEPFATFLIDQWNDPLPLPEVEPATIDFIGFCDGVTCGQTPPTCMRNWCDPCTGLCEILPDDGAACDDGDACTLGDTCLAGACAGTPMECSVGEVCFHGECWPRCDFNDLIDVFPPDCAIDARQPHQIDDSSDELGWREWVFTFACDPQVLGLTLRDFVVIAEGPLSPLIETVVPCQDSFSVRLGEASAAGEWTCLEHVDSGYRWCAGHLPGDANSDGASSAADVDALIDGLDGIEPIPDYASDINHSGTANGQDILRLIDLLNGADALDAWRGRTLPRCPS